MILPGINVSTFSRRMLRSTSKFTPSRTEDGLAQKSEITAVAMRAAVSARCLPASLARPVVLMLTTQGHLPTAVRMSCSRELSVDGFRFANLSPCHAFNMRRFVMAVTAPSADFRFSQITRGSKHIGPTWKGSISFPGNRVRPKEYSYGVTSASNSRRNSLTLVTTSSVRSSAVCVRSSLARAGPNARRTVARHSSSVWIVARESSSFFKSDAILVIRSSISSDISIDPPSPVAMSRGNGKSLLFDGDAALLARASNFSTTNWNFALTSDINSPIFRLPGCVSKI